MINQIVNGKDYTLVLDLDETLIHFDAVSLFPLLILIENSFL